MRVDGAVQGVSTIPRCRRLNVVVAIVAVVDAGSSPHPRRGGQREPLELSLAGGVRRPEAHLSGSWPPCLVRETV